MCDIKLIAQAFLMVPICTNANNCSIGIGVYGKLSFLTMTFLKANLVWRAKKS